MEGRRRWRKFWSIRRSVESNAPHRARARSPFPLSWGGMKSLVHKLFAIAERFALAVVGLPNVFDICPALSRPWLGRSRDQFPSQNLLELAGGGRSWRADRDGANGSAGNRACRRLIRFVLQ